MLVDESFDYAQTLAAVGRLIVPAFADGFSVEVDEGEIRTTLARSGRVGADAHAVELVARGKLLGVMRISGGDVSSDADSELDLWSELALRVAVATPARLRLIATVHDPRVISTDPRSPGPRALGA